MVAGNDKNISLIKDKNGNNVVLIKDILFKGKRNIQWGEVENYLKKHVGEFYVIAEESETIYLGADLPDEYAHSEYTSSLKGGNAKAKANAAQGLGEMLEIAVNKKFRENVKKKHSIDASNGWYRYESRFALPVQGDCGSIDRWNIFNAHMIIRHDQNGRKYLYDIINIKKETSTPLGC